MFSKEKIKVGFHEASSEANEYFRYFGFHQDPFKPQEEKDSLYLLPGFDQKIDLLVHYLREANVLLSLTGPKGVGKTTLVNFFLLEALHGFSPTETAVQSGLNSGEFLIQLGDNLRTCQVVADNALMPEQILEVVSGAFDVSTETFFGSCKEQSDSLLEVLQHCKQSCILLIDDAHELPDTSLDLLLYMVSLQSDAQHRLHVVLIGDPELKKRLAKIAKTKNYDGLTYSVELLPLTLSQSEYYLQHRFTYAGLDGEMPLSNSVKNKLYKLSGGVPEILNQQARQYLIALFKKKNSASFTTFLTSYKATLVGGVFLLGSFSIILAYFGQTTPVKTVTLRSDSYHPVIVRKELEQTDSKNFSVVSPSVLPPSQPRPATQVPKIQTQLQVSPEVPLQNQVQAQLATAPQSQQVAPPQVFVTPKDATLVQTASLIDPGPTISSGVSNSMVPFKSPGASKTSPLLNKQSEKIDFLKSKATKNDKTEVVPSSKKEQILGCSKRLIDANAAHYTLRLTNMASEASVKSFVAKHKLGGNVMYYSDKSNGRYVVVYGEYANLDTAKRAIQLLPKPLRRFQVQPVEISMIQQIIHQGD